MADGFTVRHMAALVLPPAHSKETRERALDLYLQGLDLDEVSQAVNVAAGTVRSWAARGFWAREKLRNAVQTAMKLAPRSGKHALRTMGDDTRTELAEIVRTQVAVLRNNPATTVAELATNSDRQGMAAVTKSVVDAASTLHGWGNEKTLGLVLSDDFGAIDVEATSEPVEVASDGQEVPQSSIAEGMQDSPPVNDKAT